MSDDFKDIWGLRNRGARDSERHKQRVRDAIKNNLRELIAEELLELQQSPLDGW